MSAGLRGEPECLTQEDERAWWMVLERAGAKGPDGLCNLFIESEYQDRLDADIMHTRSHRCTFTCKVCWEFTAHPGCAIDHEIRSRRPFRPGSLGAFLKEHL